MRIFPLIAVAILLLLLQSIPALCQAVGDYRSVGSGNWNVLATWNTWNGAAWVAAGAAPNSTNGVITIQASHTVTITANVTIDQVVVNGMLTSSGATPTTIGNGAGVDLLINGTFADNYAAATNVITWSVGATWQMGASGTLLKTTASSSNNWQSTYQGGIATIPATAFWIIRRNTAVTIPFSSTTPATGSVYPNLIIENNVAGTWLTPAGSSITGSTAFVTIKGDFDIGGSGLNFVDFANNNTNAGATIVMGNYILRSGNVMRNFGTGIEIRGNMTVNGTVSYDANDGRRLIFGGANNQAVSGSGTLNVYDMTLNKTAGSVTLNRVVTVDNLCTFTWGIVNTSTANLLIIGSAGSVTAANNNSYVDGPVRYLGNSPFTFPTGEAGDYQPIAHSGFSASAPIWSENFNNGCVQGCLGSAYAGWTQTNTGINDADANTFFVSCQENGNAIGACGTGCGSDATLHIGNVSTSPAAFLFCPTGDCGAAYDAGLGGNNVRCSKRMESPVINCTGYSNINFNFKYMEGGATTLDNATAWYFDGTSWIQVADMAKTATTCGGGQGLWTSYTIALPVSANNNPGVRIGFQWVNNDDGAGSDPSFAVDNVSLSISEYFTAEYFHSNPQIPYGATIVPSLAYLSNCEYWILDRAPASSTQTSVTLAFDANSCPVWSLSDLRVARYDGISTWQNEGNTATTGTTAAGSVSSALIVSFSPITLAAITPDPLPVELLSFYSECTGGNELLSWATMSETNNSHFEIQRSRDGFNFESIGRVNGNGTTSLVHYYTFLDVHDGTNNYYYRLKQVDFNGDEEYSSLIISNCTSVGGLDIVSVNSSSGVVSAVIGAAEGDRITAQITDMSGRSVAAQSETLQGNRHEFVFNSLSVGTYILRVNNGSEFVTRRFVVAE